MKKLIIIAICAAGCGLVKHSKTTHKHEFVNYDTVGHKFTFYCHICDKWVPLREVQTIRQIMSIN